jgi:hypothetical protein
VDLGWGSHKHQLKQMCGGKDRELAVVFCDVTAVASIHRMATTRMQYIFRHMYLLFFYRLACPFRHPTSLEIRGACWNCGERGHNAMDCIRNSGRYNAIYAVQLRPYDRPSEFRGRDKCVSKLLISWWTYRINNLYFKFRIYAP